MRDSPAERASARLLFHEVRPVNSGRFAPQLAYAFPCSSMMVCSSRCAASVPANLVSEGIAVVVYADMVREVGEQLEHAARGVRRHAHRREGRLYPENEGTTLDLDMPDCEGLHVR